MASSRATARQRTSSLSEESARSGQKRAAARAAAELVEDGMRLGLGTGSTVAYLLPAIAASRYKNLRCVATSPLTELAASALGLTVEALDEVGELDLAIDGADQIDGKEDTVITVPMGGQPREFKCQNYLYHFAMLQVQFHATTAYDLVRSTGVNIGKRDYLGQQPS